MGVREGLERVLREYPLARQEDFTQHVLADFIRHGLRDDVAHAVGQSDRLLFKGSAGQGAWARGPWVAVFDKLVTAGAQSGYYPVYLFREDMTGLYLSLNQGMTEVRRLYRSDAQTALKSRAANFRAMLGKEVAGFPRVSRILWARHNMRENDHGYARETQEAIYCGPGGRPYGPISEAA
ncbi:DUF3578 domain-containing protein [Castellaniella sp. MT123]|uniref:MrcB family domain-containing protein n=1 Tax=Castellaniella sp. MT123 TaxID=3140381 RepID=UPI0031F3AB27